MDKKNECKHEKVLVVTRYYAGTYYEPPETKVLYCECKECGETVDWEDVPKDADVEEIDYKDWY